MRVIYISNFSSYDNCPAMYEVGTDGFFLFGMGAFIAREFSKRGYKTSFEIWRSDLRIKQALMKTIDGITCRIFPGAKFPKTGEYSSPMHRELRLAAKNKEAVFHFMPNHSIPFHYYALSLKKRTVISTHIGGPNPLWNIKHHNSYTAYISYLMEKYIWLISYSNTITISQSEVYYYHKIGRPVTHMPILGISRQEIFSIQDRNECRKKLGLDQEKIVLLQVGRANENRGFDWIMKLIAHYQSNPQIELLFVGINPEDDYYQELVEAGVEIIHHIEHDKLPLFYNAADLLYYLPHGEMDLAFAGTSYVPLEALACGTPVVATTFHHFPGDEVARVSRTPKEWAEVIPMIDELLAAKVGREECRSIVLKYFGWDKVIKKHAELYGIAGDLELGN